MRIGILVVGFPPDYVGGTETQTYNMAKRLAKKHDVTVFTKACPGKTGTERQEGFRVVRINHLKIPGIQIPANRDFPQNFHFIEFTDFQI